jgi:hypothetical protein
MRKSKKLLLIAMASLTLASITACSNRGGAKTANEATASDVVELKKPKSYGKAKLGKYKGIDLSIDKVEVTDEEVDAQVNSILASNPNSQDITDRAVENGDIANIDYEGKKDGVAFDGGTAKGYDLHIGSGSFIPGFEDGVVGMKIGETKDIKLTFPEDYQSTELAGKEVVFTVKVNSIKVETPATLDDAWVEKYTNGKQKTVADFKESTRKEIEESKTMQVEFQAQNDAMKTIMDSSEFEPNNEAIEYEKNNQKNQLKKAAEENGMAFDALLSMYGMTEEQLDEQLDTYAKEAVNRRILIDTIAKEAKIKAKKEHYEYLAKQEGLEVKDLESRYGKEVVDEAAKRYAVIKFVVDKANKTERNYNQLDTGSNAGETQGEETQAK